MFQVNKYTSTHATTFGNHPVKETTTTNYNRKYAGMMYNVSGNGRDTYIYNDNGGFNAMHGPRKQD